MRKVYVAGPMRGYKEFNFPNFHRVTKELRGKGYEVFNPAERDIEHHGVDISKGNLSGCEDEAAKDHGFDLRRALGDDMEWICREADAIFLLKGWEKSKGAKAEKATCEALGLDIMYEGGM